MALQIRAGVAGISNCATPALRNPLTTAFMQAGRDPVVPASPTFLAPRGLLELGSHDLAGDNPEGLAGAVNKFLAETKL